MPNTLLALTFALLTSMAPPPQPVAATGPSPAVVAEGRAARRAHLRETTRRKTWALIDFDRDWREPRFWVLDAETDAVRWTGHVRHAGASNDERTGRAVDCSNVPGSFKSSPGSYLTATAPYVGKFGRSLRVRGLDSGVNDQALARDIVLHPAGALAYSLGCFMVPDGEVAAAVDQLAGGTFLYVAGCRAPDAADRVP